METAEETAEADKASERFMFSEECQLITFMSVVRGKLEVTRFAENLAKPVRFTGSHRLGH